MKKNRKYKFEEEIKFLILNFAKRIGEERDLGKDWMLNMNEATIEAGRNCLQSEYSIQKGAHKKRIADNIDKFIEAATSVKEDFSVMNEVEYQKSIMEKSNIIKWTYNKLQWLNKYESNNWVNQQKEENWYEMLVVCLLFTKPKNDLIYVAMNKVKSEMIKLLAFENGISSIAFEMIIKLDTYKNGVKNDDLDEAFKNIEWNKTEEKYLSSKKRKAVLLQNREILLNKKRMNYIDEEKTM